MSADNLPRPATPGPWRLVTSPEDPMEYERISYWVAADGAITDDGMPHISDAFEVRDEALGALLCSLPERVRRMDAVRGFAEGKAISARSLGRGDEERGWLDVLALLDGFGARDGDR